MNQIIFLAAEFDHKFQILENYFNTLTTSQKNYIKKDNENDNTTSSSSSTSLPLPPPSQPSSISSIESKSEFESSQSQLQSELPPPLPPNTTNNHNLPTKIESDEEIVARFHLLADEVVDILNQLQPLVKSIQSHLPENSGKINYYYNMIFSLLFSHNFIDEMIVKKEDDESDFAPKPNSLPRPKWLEILLQKYINRQTPTSGTTSSSTKNSFVLPPIGTFSSFLSCCVTEQIDCVKIEYDALVEVIFFFFIFIFIY